MAAVGRARSEEGAKSKGRDGIDCGVGWREGGVFEHQRFFVLEIYI